MVNYLDNILESRYSLDPSGFGGNFSWNLARLVIKENFKAIVHVGCNSVYWNSIKMIYRNHDGELDQNEDAYILKITFQLPELYLHVKLIKLSHSVM